MTPSDLFFSALQSLRSNTMRSVLTALGIIIGVGAVITIVAIGAGAQANIEKVIEQIGSNMLTISPGQARDGGAAQGAASRPTLTAEDASAMKAVPGVMAVAPELRGPVQVILGNQNWRTNVTGITEDFFTVRGWKLDKGRNFEDWEIDAGQKIVILGSTVAEKVFPGSDPLNQIIRIDRVPFTVIGVTAAKGQSSFGQNQDDIIFIPLKTAQQRILGSRLIKPDSVQQIAVLARNAKEVKVVERDLAELLRDRHAIVPGRADDFMIRNTSEIFQARAGATEVMTLLLTAIASVSLLVGGIGIMNIMLVSVTERTREIGVRMAIGASRTDVMMQFLIEALALSMIGGLIGIVLGMICSHLTASFAGWPLRIEASSILLAVGFSAAVGIFFGYYPARKAARLDPIEALRYA
jgi:putative ABC transport system permease protein